MRFLIIILTVSVLCGAETNSETKPPLTESAQKILTRCEADTKAELAKVKDIVRKHAAKAKVDLEAELKRETQKGNLDGALAIKAAIKELDDRTLAIAGEAEITSISSTPVKLAKGVLAGTWEFKYRHGDFVIWKIDANGVGEVLATKWGVVGFKQTFVYNSKEGYYEGVYPTRDRVYERYTFNGDTIQLEHWANMTTPVGAATHSAVCTRVKEVSK